MKKQTLILVWLTVLLTAGLLQGEDKPAQELSNTRYVWADLRIVVDPKAWSMGITENDTERLSEIMLSDEVLEAAAKDILGSSNVSDKEQFFHPMFDIPNQRGGLQMIRVRFSVVLKESHKPAAKEFAERYLEKLKAAIMKEYDFSRELHKEKIAVYMQRRDTAEMELRNLLHDQSRLAGGKGKLDQESVRQRILDHERALIENSLQQSILNKRRDIIFRQIDEIQLAAGQNAEADKLVQLIRQRLDRLESELRVNETAGTKDLAVIAGLQEKIIPLQVQLAERNQQIQGRDVESLRELNHQLRETMMQLEELEIERAVLAGYGPGSIEDSVQYEMLQVQIEAARENLRRAIIELDEFKQGIDLIQPPHVRYDKIVFGEKVGDAD